MARPEFERVENRQIVAVNMRAILTDIMTAYPLETLDAMSARIGHSVPTIKRWRKTGRARRRIAERLMQEYPRSIEPDRPPEAEDDVSLAELLDLMQRSLDRLRMRLVA